MGHRRRQAMLTVVQLATRDYSGCKETHGASGSDRLSKGGRALSGLSRQQLPLMTCGGMACSLCRSGDGGTAIDDDDLSGHEASGPGGQ